MSADPNEGTCPEETGISPIKCHFSCHSNLNASRESRICGRYTVLLYQSFELSVLGTGTKYHTISSRYADAIPRTARITPGGYPLHGINRAVMRMRIFKKEEDYALFEKLLIEYSKETGAGTRQPVTVSKTPLSMSGLRTTCSQDTPTRDMPCVYA